MIEIYTDGSCRGNGKIKSTGGFGVVVIEVDGDNKKLIEAYSEQCSQTTNNREELKAILWAMFNYGGDTRPDMSDHLPPLVYSDSSYCVNVLTDWMYNWASNGWIKSDKKTPENLDLIQVYFNHFPNRHKISLKKIKGHNGDKWNELADQLATGAITTEEAKRIYG